jgi:hypothetical protein
LAGFSRQLDSLEKSVDNLMDMVPGVDTTPRHNSANLITSGGVHGALLGYMLRPSGGTSGQFLQRGADNTFVWANESGIVGAKGADGAGALGAGVEPDSPNDGTAITDLTMDSNKAINAARQKFVPFTEGGVPAAQLAQAIQDSLVKADTALQASGGTMTGDLTLRGNPTAANHAATKGYVDALVGTSGTANINKPNTWTANTTIDFGNNLFGFRRTGNITPSGGSATINLTMQSGASVLSVGGWIGSAARRLVPYYLTADDNASFTHSSNSLDVIVRSSASAPYDVWVLYSR